MVELERRRKENGCMHNDYFLVHFWLIHFNNANLIPLGGVYKIGLNLLDLEHVSTGMNLFSRDTTLDQSLPFFRINEWFSCLFKKWTDWKKKYQKLISLSIYFKFIISDKFTDKKYSDNVNFGIPFKTTTHLFHFAT